jgi:hypothetical protein
VASLWGALALACQEEAPKPKPVPLDTVDAAVDAGTHVSVDCADTSRNHDVDGDGFSSNFGDCDDCDPMINPSALDVPGDGHDQDCDGADATELPSCDGQLDASGEDPDDAARALGLCSFPTFRSRLWGVTATRFLRLNGSEELEDPRQVWISERFGAVSAVEGHKLLVLSTGVARDISDPDYTPECDVFSSIQDALGEHWSGGATPPAGYPKDSSQCAANTSSMGIPAYNDVGLEIELHVPTNAHSFSFDSIFFTYEYPDFVCSPFNDFFLAFVDPAPADLTDGNVLFDDNGDNAGVNTALLSVCRENLDRSGRPISCQQGAELLAGTGFDEGESTCAAEVAKQDWVDIGGGSTGWLRTTVPVEPGSDVTLRFVLWDSGDPLLDSTVAIDNFRFLVEASDAPHTAPFTTH